MAQFQVDSGLVHQASANARTSASTIRSEVAGMVAHLTALQDSWRGSASAAFSATLEQWRATQQQVEDSLDSISLCLDSGAGQYEEAENHSLRMFAV